MLQEPPIVYYFKKEITFPPEAEGPRELLVPWVINTGNTKPLRKGEEWGKQATTVMEFIPSAQNIAQVLNRGPAEEGRVLSPAYALGLLYRGQAKETMLETGREHCGCMCSKEKWHSR